MSENLFHYFLSLSCNASKYLLCILFIGSSLLEKHKTFCLFDFLSFASKRMLNLKATHQFCTLLSRDVILFLKSKRDHGCLFFSQFSFSNFRFAKGCRILFQNKTVLFYHARSWNICKHNITVGKLQNIFRDCDT